MHQQPDLESSLALAADILREAKHAVALTGAGLSAESGIPTYRGPDGEWTKFGEPTIDGWELFRSDPAAWWREATRERETTTAFSDAIEAAVPNPGHVAMAELESLGHLAHVITQNIDDLHRKAGTRYLTEIHGNRFLARCTNCGRRDPMERVRLDALPPLCLDCGGYLKNDTVMFGEPIPDDALKQCYREAILADAFLVVGTSAVVYPAAEFPVMAKQRGAPLIEINPGETDLSSIADIVVRAPAGTAIPMLVELLR